MAKDERTEKATPRKRKLEREQGNLPRSKEVTTFLSLLSLTMMVFIFGSKIVQDTSGLVNYCFNMIMTGVKPGDFIANGFKRVFSILVPVLILGTIFHILDYFLQVRFLFSWKIIKPNFKRMFNVSAVFGNIFSRKKIIDVLRNFIMLFVFSFIAWLVLKGKVSLITSSLWFPWQKTLANIYSILKTTLVSMVSILFIVAIVDFLYQNWEYEQKIKMKKQEIKDEMKNNEGNPEVKRRRKEFMYALLQKDMSRHVPEATVIINNPTHISVALRYRKGVDDLPVVIAKGEERLALYIRTLAKEHKIPMVENKPLARALYFNVEVNEAIPEDMFEAVATVLRYLIETNQLEL